ncbi:hypothetical protein LOZ58_001583 [Ophidiomyces ophidiicola]|nr:hypothetical protein LOZ58_001583 [Ophidiomyces ophidiicola]
MSTRRLIIFGATDNQRGSVVHVATNDPVRSSAFHTTRTVTRQAGSPAAKPLHSHGIGEIWANMNSPAWGQLRQDPEVARPNADNLEEMCRTK